MVFLGASEVLCAALSAMPLGSPRCLVLVARSTKIEMSKLFWVSQLLYRLEK